MSAPEELDRDLHWTITEELSSYYRQVGLKTTRQECEKSAAVILRTLRQTPRKAWTFTVTREDDTLWLSCDYCAEPVCEIQPGDDLEQLLAWTRDHVCRRQAGAFTRKERA